MLEMIVDTEVYCWLCFVRYDIRKVCLSSRDVDVVLVELEEEEEESGDEVFLFNLNLKINDIGRRRRSEENAMGVACKNQFLVGFAWFFGEA